MKLYHVTRKLMSILGIYYVYERLLLSEVKKGPIPKHIGIILDGNRRWASVKGVGKEVAYNEGAKKVENIIKWCEELNIKTVTMFVLSTENFMRRTKDEIDIIFNLLKKYLNKLLQNEDRLYHKLNIKFIGDLSLLKDRELLNLIKEVERKYCSQNGLNVNVAFLYGGKWDIVNATKNIIKEVIDGSIHPEDITAETFQKYLSTSHLDHQDIDLILRTGGESRLSNFLLWQAAYSELVFLDVFWPDFRKIDFLRAIRIFQRRSRRFGA